MVLDDLACSQPIKCSCEDVSIKSLTMYHNNKTEFRITPESKEQSKQWAGMGSASKEDKHIITRLIYQLIMNEDVAVTDCFPVLGNIQCK